VVIFALVKTVPGYPKIPADLLDRPALDEVLAPNARNRFHDQHLPTTRS